MCHFSKVAEVDRASYEVIGLRLALSPCPLSLLDSSVDYKMRIMRIDFVCWSHTLHNLCLLRVRIKIVFIA